MRTYYFKIREKFIKSVENGTKKHEYRLASEENRRIQIGDNLILISNQNRKNYIRVTVDAFTIYNGWREALKDNWENDFKGLYNSIDEAVTECDKFYERSEVLKNGIICFSIRPVKTNYFAPSILIDTNIVIKRESMNNVSYEVTQLFNWFDKENMKKLIHPSTIKELEKYSNANARNAMLIKINSYYELPKMKCEKDNRFREMEKLYTKSENDKVDDQLLLEVYNDNVDMLLSDDKKVLLKAEELYIREKVVSSLELLTIYENHYPNNIDYKMLAVKLKEFNDINLYDSFFDSLREDYGGQDFDRWFKKKAIDKQEAYVFEEKDEIKGFLYLKDEDEKENYSDINPIFPPKKRLKIGTFKIDKSGFRLGERFLKIIFDNAIKRAVDEIYVTLFENRREGVDALEKLLMDWGFFKYGSKKSGEIVLVKKMRLYDSDYGPKYNFPNMKDDKKYYFLPIYPKYHTDLFPDNILKNENMHLYEENLAHRYAIEKVYLSGAIDIKAKPGDIIVIYRIGDQNYKRFSSVVTGFALLEEICYTNNVDECISICKNRSIFSESEIRKVYSKYRIVVKLLNHTTFNNKITLDELRKNNIIDYYSGPRPFTELRKEEFEIIKEIGMKENDK